MKRFSDLNEAELTSLTDADIARYIDYACAENGVALLPTLPPAPQPVEFTPDAKLYQVDYHWSFATAEDAAKVVQVLNECRAIDTGYLQTPSSVTSTVISGRKSAPSMSVQDAFSAELAAKLKDELAGAKQAEDIYAKAKKVYDAAVSERECYADEIRDKVANAWEVRNRREARQRDYDRYLELADGNADIALRFLVKAHGDTQTLLPSLFERHAVEAEPVVERAAASGQHDVSVGLQAIEVLK